MASLSIKNQIYLAVGSALGLLAVLGMISYLAVVKLAAIFAEYQATAHQTLFANEFFEDVYNTQFAAFGYRLTPSEQEAEAVWSRVAQIADRTASAELTFDGDDVAVDLLQRISQSTQHYRDAFARMTELKAESDVIVAQLSTMGPRIRQKLTTIMDFAYENGDTWVGYDIGVAQQELMRGRFYHERYLITNDPETFTTALSFLDAAIRNIQSLSPRLYDPTMQELAGQAVEEISAYILSARQNYDVLVMRNEVRDHKLDTLGPEIKNELEQLLHSVVDRQRALGSRASQGSEVTLISVLILSTIAIGLGIFLAIFVGRHISRRICAMAETMNQLAEGDLHIEIGDKDQRHELGMMARALEVFRFNAQELEKALQKERELNGLQRQFVSMVSHEFRTPLAIIDANAHHLSRRQDRISADRVKKALATIRKSVVRLTDLMESVLSAARMEDGKIAFDPAEFDLHEMITEVCRNYAEISESHAIITDLSSIPTRFVGDVKLLRQAVSNLISNAVKYSPGKDSVFVSGTTNQDGTIVISFRDEGVGIPSEELEKLFERFFRASTSTGIPGSGIGLHLVNHIVELHEGTLTVTSDVGKGSIFEIHLPIVKAESGPEVEAERPKQLETLDDLLCIK